jgi:NADH-quinone oxidoreductase subunit K
MISYADFYLILAILLFSIGAFGVLVKKNTIVMLMCIVLMLNAVNLVLVVFSKIHGNIDGQIFAIFIVGVTVAQVALGTAIIINLFRNFRSVKEVETFAILPGQADIVREEG